MKTGVPKLFDLVLSENIRHLAEKGFKTYVFDPAQSESQINTEEALRQYADHRVLFQEDFLEVINDIIYPLTT